MESLLIYVAGPYTGKDRQEIESNVNYAIDIGIDIFNKGHFPYIPHLTDLVDKRAKEMGKEMFWEDFISWDVPWLKVCDALYFIKESKGANIELEEAKKLGKIIFYNNDEVPNVIKK